MATAKKATMADFKIKCMVWGEPGAGKTRFALSAPKPLVIDLENSTALYSNEFDFYRAVIDQSKNDDKYKINNAVNLTLQIIDEIAKGEYNGEVETLVIDPITDLLDNIEAVLCNKYESMIGKNIQQLSAIQKTKWYAYRRDGIRKVLDKLINLPVNIVWVAREKNVWEQTSQGMQPKGKTFDGLDIIEYLPDIVIHLKKDGESQVKKSRIGNIPSELEIKNWDSITKVLETKNVVKKTALKAI